MNLSGMITLMKLLKNKGRILYGNISTQVIVEVPAICMCASISVRNVGTQDIQLQNANMTIVFDGVHQ